MNIKIIKYLNNSFGINIEFFKVQKNELKNIPYFLTEAYNYNKVKFLNQDLIFIEKKSEEKYTAAQFKSHINIIRKNLEKPVVLILKDIESYNRLRLIKQQINFIIADKQIFLPFLQIDLNDISNAKTYNNEYLQPVSQILLLYHLQNESINGMDIDTIANKLGYSNMAISRAIRELHNKNLCKIKGKRNLTIELETNKIKLWWLIIDYLKSPVIKTFYMDNIPEEMRFYSSNLNALSFYTNIADYGKKCIAITKNSYYKGIKNNTEIINSYEGEIFVEVWNYDPGKLKTIKEFVDPLSLYLIFRESPDERIQNELKNLIEKFL